MPPVMCSYAQQTTKEGFGMALKLEFCNVIVPVAKIREKLGAEAFESRFSNITETTWHDGRIFRDGCMNQYDLKEMLEEWERRGFHLLTIKEGKKQWMDLCVVNSGYGPSYPCHWIQYDAAKNIVWLKGAAPGAAVGPTGRKMDGED